MKLLFVFTGGTIGSVEKNGVADVDSSTSEKISQLCSHEGDTIEFASPYNILSENATEETLSDILNYMLSIDYDRFDGVIVTHGSDTAAFTANLLAHALAWVKIPIAVTAANYVMTDPRSNARDNITAAYTFIKDVYEHNSYACGVFFVWTNTGENPKIHIGSRLLEADGYHDSFDSFGEVYAEIKDGRFFGTRQPIYPDTRAMSLKGESAALKNNVLLLHSYVGLDYRDINIKGKAAVLLKLYHSGTACMGESAADSRSFLYLADMCKKEGIDLYITPAKKGSYIYRSAEGFESTVACPLFGMSEYSAYTLLLLAYNTNNDYFYYRLKNNLN